MTENDLNLKNNYIIIRTANKNKMHIINHASADALTTRWMKVAPRSNK